MVVGWVWGCRQRHVGGYSQVQLHEIGVAEAQRGRGIGRALLTAFREHAISEGHRRMWLFTDEDNHAAKALYESAGGSPSPHDDAGYWWQLDIDLTR
ncbi:GNAT family N-acetyltransferase [Actinosynnema sp. NPDC050436]|uniref:GNAT family N-acetyltransferase n=1 Tax=Actinosynnema sp. NPDC050436 TaxID=3155659 RepID=UPI003400D8F7